MPITIGALTSVPAPGDPVASPWAQAVSGFAVHQFATFAALQAQWPTAPNGSTAVTRDTGTIYRKISAGAGGWTSQGLATQAASGGNPGAITDAGDFTVFANVNSDTAPWNRAGLIVVQALATAVGTGQLHLRLRRTNDNAVDAVGVVQAPGTAMATILLPFSLAAGTNGSWYVQWRGVGATGSCFTDPTTNKWATYAWPV